MPEYRLEKTRAAYVPTTVCHFCQGDGFTMDPGLGGGLGYMTAKCEACDGRGRISPATASGADDSWGTHS